VKKNTDLMAWTRKKKCMLADSVTLRGFNGQNGWDRPSRRCSLSGYGVIVGGRNESGIKQGVDRNKGLRAHRCTTQKCHYFYHPLAIPPFFSSHLKYDLIGAYYEAENVEIRA
jgi:hypothetical protein